MIPLLLTVLAGCGAGGSLSSTVGGAAIAVTTDENLTAYGVTGQGFAPNSITYQVSNLGESELQWQVVADQDWVDASPSAGDLAPQQSVAVVVSLNSEANQLAAGSHASLLQFRNLSGGIGDTSRTVSVTVTSPSGTAMTTATRTAGVAPLSVVFDAVGGASGVMQPSGSTPDHSSFCYEWDYGDPTSGVWPHNGKSRNRSTGWIGAHVYDAPGSYRATLRVTTDAGITAEYYQDIVVSDPDVVFAGRTFYVAANGSDTNPGTMAQPFATIGRGMSAAFPSSQPTRLLFRRGDTFATSTTYMLPNGTAASLIGAYGTGAKPVLQCSGTNGGMNFSGRQDVRLVDLDLVASGTTMLSYARGVQLGHGSTVLRCRIDSFGYGADGSYISTATVCDCEILNGVEYGFWAFSPNLQAGNHLAVLGNRFDQAGFHLTRVYINRSIFMSNLYQRGGFTAMALVGRDTVGQPTQFNCIIDNSYTTETQDVVAMGPANGQFNEYAQDYLFEGNRFYSRAGTGSCLRIRGFRVTIRNNIFDLANRRAVQIGQWSTSSPVPPPSDVRVEHNTCYRGSGSPLRFVSAQTANSTMVRNNILYCPQGTAEVPSGTVTAVQNLTANPLFVNAGVGDFQLSLGSPAIDVAVPSTVRTDFLRAARPLAPTVDIGAMER